MWRVLNHRLALPPSIELREDEDTVSLTCLRCGWEQWYYCHTADPVRMEAETAKHHRLCPEADDRVE